VAVIQYIIYFLFLFLKYNLNKFKKQSGTCKFDLSKSAAKITSYVAVTNGIANETLLTNAIANVGPISVALYVTSNFQNYKSGVFRDTTCPNSVDHAVTLVGYGTLNGQDHYILKNSWGTNWGDQGYMLFARNNNNMCNIAYRTYYPVVLKDSNSTTLPITTTTTTRSPSTTTTTRSPSTTTTTRSPSTTTTTTRSPSTTTTTRSPSTTSTTRSPSTSSGNQPTKLMYPYGPNSGDTLLPKDDDGSYGPIKIGLQFPFFSQTYSSLYVNSDGVISFHINFLSTEHIEDFSK
jgi:hypothetical protein